jgi:hypothetical protein
MELLEATLVVFFALFAFILIHRAIKRDVAVKRSNIAEQKRNAGTQLNLELEQSKQRLVNLSTAYSNGKISEATFIATSKKLEAKIASLEAMKASGDFDSFLNQPYDYQDVGEKPSGWWYLLPLCFGFLGGLIGYVGVKDRNKGMAEGLLFLGVVVSIILVIITWIFFFPHDTRI